MTENKSSLSIVVPVYCAEKTLEALVDQLSKTLPELTDQYEIILVNDGSKDKSWPLIEELVHKNSRITGINLMRNYGQHNALLCGIRAAKNDIVVTMDDDLQHPPETIHILLEKLTEGYDVVYGSPITEKHGILRDAASLTTKLVMQNVMNVDTARYVSAYRAFCTQLRDSFANYQGSTVSIDVLLTWGTNKFAYVKVEHHARYAGESHYTFRKLVSHAMNMITGFSTIPLRISSGVGFFFTLFGIVVFLYAFLRYLISGGSTVPGFTFLASVIAIFSGAQLFALGIMGEYLARMHFRLMDKPSYTIKDEVDHD
jgi:undecaprenyl-phosphate 4-deoxy-4-formamido-L-arabinose transferase